MAKTSASEFRVKFEYETDPDLSYLEQWDTPETYYGEVPKCSHGTRMQYSEDFGALGEDRWYCDCLTTSEDEDPRVHETKDPLDIDHSKGGVILEGGDKGKPVRFPDYMKRWGNPDRHVTLCALVERKCGSCGNWDVADSLGNIDFMDWDPYQTGTFTAEEARALKGYCGEVAREMLDSAKDEDCCAPTHEVYDANSRYTPLALEIDKALAKALAKVADKFPGVRVREFGALAHSAVEMFVTEKLI